MTTQRKRGFECISTYPDAILPKRATHGAAGYDFYAAETIVVPSIWQQGVFHALKTILSVKLKMKKDSTFTQGLTPTLVPTGVKAYMLEGEYLQLCNRSSTPLKKGLMMPNGIGIIDQDYYNNENNEGHIYFMFINFSTKDQVIQEGERIGQGIFLPFLTADQDITLSTRSGGFGSSDQ